MKYKSLIFCMVIASMTKNSEILIIAHRGASGYEPENTLSAFKKAIKLGGAMIEFDIHKASTGELVVIHDKRVDRTTNGTGLVQNLSLEQLKKFRTKNNETIPTLQEALDCIDKKAKVNIEIKAQDCEKKLVNIIEDYVENKGWQYDDFLVSSFNHHQLKKIKELNPHIPVAVLMSGIPIDYAAMGQKINAFSIHAFKEFVTKEYVDDAHNRDMQFFIFTINDSNEAQYFIELGVDGIFTDYPDLLEHRG